MGSEGIDRNGCEGKMEIFKIKVWWRCVWITSYPRRMGRLYTRNGKRYYRPYRNYFYGNDSDLDKLVEAGYMEYYKEISNGKTEKTYWFNRTGLDRKSVV